ncbi:DNA translocase FtsK [Serratia ficaria]|uniref:DNA translocase FtsK n=1 Tax=Serratia ficaria TaxID=61651 RepID=UPI00217C3AA1|nr:DNA translocase FtsK [Serratia ficaria]CAI1104479.1 DNA translocase FtsK [Serratia ficaria]CAI1940844.1 DNA translocase FtsK [Serratia ficaria]CAI2465382.1 DNA translocase FtsK [Serratia ficaria]CAI2787728.1 DNA translocase FtsK [Serratia ficaria]
MKERPVIFSEDEEQLYAKAVEFTRMHACVWVAQLQRHLRIGYYRAAWLIERMQKEGVITATAWNGVSTVIHGGSDASK